MLKRIEIIKLMNKVLKPHGFHHRGSNWHLGALQCVQVINLQRSPFSSKYFVNLGILLRGLSDMDRPKEEHCHLRIRLESLCRDPSVISAFDLEDRAMADDERNAEITQAVTGFVVPFLSEMKNLEAISAVCQARKYPDLWITLDAERFLASLREEHSEEGRDDKSIP